MVLGTSWRFLFFLALPTFEGLLEISLFFFDFWKANSTVGCSTLCHQWFYGSDHSSVKHPSFSNPRHATLKTPFPKLRAFWTYKPGRERCSPTAGEAFIKDLEILPYLLGAWLIVVGIQTMRHWADDRWGLRSCLKNGCGAPGKKGGTLVDFGSCKDATLCHLGT